MVILKILGGIMLVILGLLFIYYASLFALMCYDERKEAIRRQGEQSEERERFEGIQDDWSWTPERWEEFLETEEKLQQAMKESKEKNVSPGTHR